jgi:hypothetical protein
MNEEEQQANLEGRINGSNVEEEVHNPNLEADLQGFQKPQLKKSKNKIIIGVISGLAVILAGAVVVLATGIWNPIWNPFQPSPNKVLAEAFENMLDLKTVHSKIIYEIDVQGKENFSVEMIMEGNSDATDILNPKSHITIDTSVFVEEIEMFFDVEIRSIDEVLYFKVGTIPIIFSLELSKIGINVSDWTNKWFKFDSQELGMSFIKTLSDEKKVNIEKELVQLLSEYPIAIVAEKLIDEKIEGQNTYHYLLALDKENLKQFLVGLMEIVDKYYAIDDLINMPEEDKQEMSDGIDEFFQAIGGIDFEIWIGKKDKLIYKVAGRKNLDLSIMELEGEGTLSLNFDMSFSKFNESMEIITPENSQNIIEILMPFIQMFMGGGMEIENQLPGYELPF